MKAKTSKAVKGWEHLLTAEGAHPAVLKAARAIGLIPTVAQAEEALCCEHEKRQAATVAETLNTEGRGFFTWEEWRAFSDPIQKREKAAYEAIMRRGPSHGSGKPPKGWHNVGGFVNVQPVAPFRAATH